MQMSLLFFHCHQSLNIIVSAVGLLIKMLCLTQQAIESIISPKVTLLHKVMDNCGSGSVVGITSGYELDGPGIESRWGPDFAHLFRLALGPNQPPVQWVLSLSRGLRAARA